MGRVFAPVVWLPALAGLATQLCWGSGASQEPWPLPAAGILPGPWAAASRGTPIASAAGTGWGKPRAVIRPCFLPSNSV